MPHYAFTVTDASGERSSGTVIATDRDSAMKMLAEKDLVVTRLTPLGGSRGGLFARINPLRKRIPVEELLVFTRQVAAMLDAGMTVKGAVDAMLVDCSEGTLHDMLLELSTGLAAGSSVTEMLARFPTIFDAEYVATVSAGEAGGKLPLVLERLASLIERSDQLRRKVKSALYYPAMVTGFAMLMVLLLFAFGIPRFQAIYTGFGGKLPTMTEVIIQIGAVVAVAWPYALVFALAAGYGIRAFVETEKGKRLLDSTKLRLPLFGDVFRKVAITRFSRTLSTLHSSGVPISQSLELVAATMGNVVMEQVVRSSLAEVLVGESIVGPLRRSKLFTEMAVSMIAAGERAGQLDRMLDKVAEFYEAQIEITLRGLTSLVEPVIMIFVGVVVGVVIVAMILPIFKLASLLFT